MDYPLDVEYILRKKKSLKKQLLASNDRLQKKIAILGGSTTSEIKNILELFLLNSGIEPVFYESDYNKYFEDALFDNEQLDKFQPDIIYIHSSIVNILNFPKPNDGEDVVNQLLNDEVERYTSIWDALQKYDCAIIQNNFDYPIDRSLGNLDNYDIHGKTFFIMQLNLEFSKNARKINNLYINDINYLSSYIGLEKWVDRSLWYQAKYALSMAAIPELSFNISKIINSILGRAKKCLVLDLDNTCWGGVIGDDGLVGISIGNETAVAEAFETFQKYAKELKDRGVMLAVCSKNYFQNAAEGFQHPETILKFEDFTSFKANWDPKHQNIIDIAQEINIGIDSLVFIDDNPAERDIVSSQIPDVSVPDVGRDVIFFIDHIDKNGYFEPIILSTDDMKRNQYYEDNKKRLSVKSKYATYGDYLKSLEMVAEINSFNSLYLDRITQLTNKTNQFNLTTKRYTYSEIEKISSSNDYIKLYGKLTDKYGDNGLISITIGCLKNGQCFIELWLMSCRVLKRNMEYAMLDELVIQCQQRNITEIIGYYLETEKNKMVAKLYEDFGFILMEKNDSSSVWKLDIKNYKAKNKFIRTIG